MRTKTRLYVSFDFFVRRNALGVYIQKKFNVISALNFFCVVLKIDIRITSFD